MKADVLSLQGKVVRSVELPSAFAERVRRELISRAVVAEQSRSYQPKGAFILAGMQTTAEYKGRKEDYRSIKNRGISRLPREKLPKGAFGRVRIVPFSVKGRRAHPPKPEKVLVEKINEREQQKALRSAIAATASEEAVRGRGHFFNGRKLPIVMVDEIQSLAKTKDVFNALSAIGLGADLQRAREKLKPFPGRRGGRTRPKSVIIIVGEDKGILKGARNIPGVDACLAEKLSVSLLAPGAHPGRLAVYSESALARLEV